MKNEAQISGIDLLLIRCISGEASEQEQADAFEWINSGDENRKYYGNLRDAWLASALDTPIDSITLQNVWRKVKSRSTDGYKEVITNDRIGSSFQLRSLMRYAAIAVLFMAIGALTFFILTPKSVSPQSLTYAVEAPMGAKAKVTLPDGTVVNLNAGSKLTYTSLYNVKDRVVALSGEAFFKVAKVKSKPFKVTTSQVLVQALGTSFNVKAYPQDDIIETTLIEGVVKVESKDSHKSEFVLKPNEKHTFKKSNNSVEVSEVRGENEKIQEEKKTIQKELQKLESIESITSWKDNKLIFENESLSEMVAKMQRWYGVEVHLSSVDSSGARYSGKFIYNETIYQVLDVLSRTTPIHYETKDHKIYIYSN